MVKSDVFSNRIVADFISGWRDDCKIDDANKQSRRHLLSPVNMSWYTWIIHHDRVTFLQNTHNRHPIAMAGCGMTIVTHFKKYHALDDWPGHTKHWIQRVVPHIDSNARQTSNIWRTWVCNKIDRSDVVGASPVLSTLLQLHLHSRLNTWL